VQTAIDCQNFGADGITVHPRPDERHIRYDDVLQLKEVVKTEFNIEGYPDRRYIDLVKMIRAAQATLVPDGPDVLTSNAGWDTIKNKSFLAEIISELKSSGIRVSVFTDPITLMVNGAAEVGADRIELYTEPYASNYTKDPESAVSDYVFAANEARKLGLGINAGHDLDLKNLRFLIEKIPYIDEVSIGHALICDALYYGLENVIQMYKGKLKR
jgi:pyridoxine 5-phosphate synthase